MTGFSLKVRRQIHERDGGVCQRCGGQGANIQHRIGRGAGGTSRTDVNEVSAGVTLCGFGNVNGCHGWAEKSPEAVALGWSIRRWDRRHPSEIPLTDIHGRTFLLTRDGSVFPEQRTAA